MIQGIEWFCVEEWAGAEALAERTPVKQLGAEGGAERGEIQGLPDLFGVVLVVLHQGVGSSFRVLGSMLGLAVYQAVLVLNWFVWLKPVFVNQLI